MDKEKRSMFLTNDRARRFQDHLRSADVTGSCAMCHTPIDWAQTAELHEIIYAGTGGRLFDTRRVVACTCPHCAVVIHFDATAIDL
jgi:hypothetical protein